MFSGKALWIISTSAFLIGVPWALAYAEEEQYVQMEREQGMIRGANEVCLTPNKSIEKRCLPILPTHFFRCSHLASLLRNSRGLNPLCKGKINESIRCSEDERRLKNTAEKPVMTYRLLVLQSLYPGDAQLCYWKCGQRCVSLDYDVCSVIFPSPLSDIEMGSFDKDNKKEK